MTRYHQIKTSGNPKFPWWRAHLHWRIKEVIDGLSNIVRWIPTLYRDRDWDDSFILTILQKKIEHQREYLSKYSWSVDSERYMRDMTRVLNLIERVKKEHYGCEYFSYHENSLEFEDADGNPDLHEVFFNLKWEKYDEYLAKYPNTVRRVKQKFPEVDFSDKMRLCIFVSNENEKRAHSLLWRIMNERSREWWD
jgi:hypothetical protein